MSSVDNAHAQACEGCGAQLGAIEALRWSVCMDCTRARAATVGRHGRCACGRKARPRPASNGVRSWSACERCLGAIPERKGRR